jgi:molecular chaperone GrpE
MHSYSADVTEPTCVRILQPGYKIGDRILRPARVAVAEPGDIAEPGDPAEPADQAAAGAAGAQETGPAADDSVPRASDGARRASDPD